MSAARLGSTGHATKIFGGFGVALCFDVRLKIFPCLFEFVACGRVSNKQVLNFI